MSSNSMLGKGTPGTASLNDGANARQVGGTHYSGSEYQHWDYATDLRMVHLEGAATKYLARAGNKAGEPREKDLGKTLHYLEKLLEVYKEGRLVSLADRQGAGFNVTPLLARFVASSMSGHAFTPRSVAALTILSRWANEVELEEAVRYVTDELKEEQRKPRPATEAETRRAIINESPLPRGL